MSKENAKKPSVLEEEEEQEQEQALQDITGTVTVTANSDEIAEPETRENVKEYMGKLLLISSFTIRPVLKDNKFMYVSHIDGCVIENADVVNKIKEIGAIDKEVKELIKKECQPVKLYSTSSGVAVSLNSYVKDALKKGKVLVEISSKKGRYPQDIILLKNPFA
jgi:uncharacterized protein YeeX (DUF496 family)